MQDWGSLTILRDWRDIQGPDVTANPISQNHKAGAQVTPEKSLNYCSPWTLGAACSPPSGDS